IVAEMLSSGEAKFYTNADMERGNELESLARAAYEMERDVTVEQVGFVEYSKYVGGSPDGLVGEDGGVEIKCHDDAGHLKFLLNGEDEIDSKYKWQVQANLLITGRKWWDYISYNPNFKKSLVVIRIEPDQLMHEKLHAGFEAGAKKIEELIKKVNL